MGTVEKAREYARNAVGLADALAEELERLKNNNLSTFGLD